MSIFYCEGEKEEREREREKCPKIESGCGSECEGKSINRLDDDDVVRLADGRRSGSDTLTRIRESLQRDGEDETIIIIICEEGHSQ